jgi:hypothetical protein
MKNSNYTIGNRSGDLPACSAMPQPLRHRVPHVWWVVSRISTYAKFELRNGLRSRTPYVRRVVTLNTKVVTSSWS